jgi:hypothetical protein
MDCLCLCCLAKLLVESISTSQQSKTNAESKKATVCQARGKMMSKGDAFFSDTKK